jgi:hypothetical protein
MVPRLATSVLVSALLRLAEREGGFGAVLAKGDPTAGAVLVILAERGRKSRIVERLLQPNGDYSWQDATKRGADDSAETEKFLERRRQYDPDIWIVELDIPSPERFAAEMNSLH